MPKGFVYILQCSDGSYYTGSTFDIEKRLVEHQTGKGANHTKKRLPIELVYLEEFQRIDEAFNREKQIQGWNRLKKEALIQRNYDKLPELSLAYRDKVASSTSATERTMNEKNKVVPEALEGTMDSKTVHYHSHGKLLLTGEYVVLDGALSLALPTKFGQSLNVFQIQESQLKWTGFDQNKDVWLHCDFDLKDGVLLSTQNDSKVVLRLLEILEAAQILNPNFLKLEKGLSIETHLDFDRTWGLGTSSTLINNIANWANIDPYQLLEKTFGGSGYDIACASANQPITYQIFKDSREIDNVDFDPPFKEHLYFVYLNTKKNSREAILQYKANRPISGETISEISTITNACIVSKSLETFKYFLKTHERIISKVIKQPTVQEALFKDFTGQLKSLGGWGGDFILAVSEENPTPYFKEKGFLTVLPYKDIIL